uniref:Gamma-secretase subunit PEN-2 n=1 Tax=Trieres chinensis TaxID=1514140 RepID=A0A7S1Z7A5_TRICV|mmetsp:Transcript_19014/g.38540  ORF Transcript_19014/g.38540 Transcript_19014/m.38540 type:complete len:139 (+) Transcript_19014:221-637(+)
MRDDKLARLMFFGGCALLPWLWCVNILYFRKNVYGHIPLIDDWLCSGESGGIIDGPPALGAMGSEDDDENNSEFDDERSVPPRSVEEEVSKWVKRSTFGAAAVLSALVAWIVSFQLNKEKFPSGWFVMDMDEGARTGW